MTRATVREIDGQLVIDDPDAVAVIRVIERENIGGIAVLATDRDISTVFEEAAL
jgi:hypothetical protein